MYTILFDNRCACTACVYTKVTAGTRVQTSTHIILENAKVRYAELYTNI